MKKIMLSSILIISLVFISFPVPNVYASDGVSTCELGDDAVATNNYKVKSKSQISDTYGEWTTVASNTTGASKDGEVLGATVNMSWSNSITGSSSLSYQSKKGLTATMGFDVTKTGSISVGSQYSITLNKGEKGYIKARPVYDTYSCKLQRQYLGTGVDTWVTVSGTYTAKKFSGGADYITKVW